MNYIVKFYNAWGQEAYHEIHAPNAVIAVENVSKLYENCTGFTAFLDDVSFSNAYHLANVKPFYDELAKEGEASMTVKFGNGKFINLPMGLIEKIIEELQPL